MTIDSETVKEWYENFRNKTVLVNYSIKFYRGSKKIESGIDIADPTENVKKRMKGGQVYLSETFYRRFDSISTNIRKRIAKYVEIQFHDGDRGHKDITKIKTGGMLKGYSVPVIQLPKLMAEIAIWKQMFDQTVDEFISDYPELRENCVDDLCENYSIIARNKYARTAGVHHSKLQDYQLENVTGHVDTYRENLKEHYPPTLSTKNFNWEFEVDPPKSYEDLIYSSSSTSQEFQDAWNELGEAERDAITPSGQAKAEKLAEVFRIYEAKLRTKFLTPLLRIQKNVKKNGLISASDRNNLLGYDKEIKKGVNKGKTVRVRGIIEQILELDITGKLTGFLIDFIDLLEATSSSDEKLLDETTKLFIVKLDQSILDINTQLDELDDSEFNGFAISEDRVELDEVVTDDEDFDSDLL